MHPHISTADICYTSGSTVCNRTTSTCIPRVSPRSVTFNDDYDCMCVYPYEHSSSSEGECVLAGDALVQRDAPACARGQFECVYSRGRPCIPGEWVLDKVSTLQCTPV
jgi:hypothetical protein